MHQIQSEERRRISLSFDFGLGKVAQDDRTVVHDADGVQFHEHKLVKRLVLLPNGISLLLEIDISYCFQESLLL